MGGKKEAIKLASSRHFPWTASNPTWTSVVHAIVFGRIGLVRSPEETEEANKYGSVMTASDAEFQDRLDLLEHALEYGADPYIPTPAECNLNLGWGSEDAGDIEVDPKEKNVVELLLALEREIKSRDHWQENWRDDLERINKLLTIIVRSDAGEGVADNVSIHGKVVDMWTSVLADGEAADVVISAKSPGSSSTNFEEVPALRVILCHASPVLKAMLTGSMREGVSQKIVVDDCSGDAVKMLLALLYTGTLTGEDEPQMGTMLDALMLAHRWQVQHV